MEHNAARCVRTGSRLQQLGSTGHAEAFDVSAGSKSEVGGVQRAGRLPDVAYDCEETIKKRQHLHGVLKHQPRKNND